MLGFVERTALSKSAYALGEEEERITVVISPLARGTGSDTGVLRARREGEERVVIGGMSRGNSFFHASVGQHPRQNPDTYSG
jgi:hypothetical protein